MKLRIRILIIFFVILFCVVLFYLLANKTREGIDPDLNNIANPLMSFCSSYIGNASELNKSCGELTKGNCQKTSCCVLVNNESCVAGDKTGPRYRSTPDGKNIEVKQYNHEGNCYGDMCK